jgi:hypothetical protein
MNMSWAAASVFISATLGGGTGNSISSQTSTEVNIQTKNNCGTTTSISGSFTNGVLHWTGIAPAVNCGTQEYYTVTVYVDSTLISSTFQNYTISGNTVNYTGTHTYSVEYKFDACNQNSTGSFAISLSLSNSGTITYSVAVWDSTTGSLITTLSNATSPATYGSITPQHSYYYIVSATNALDTASSTSSTVQYVPPTAPTLLSATFTTNTINMTWSPSSNGSITYIVDVYDTSSVTRITSINSATSPATYGSLTYTHSYYFIVIATNAQGSTSTTSSTYLLSAPSNPPSSFTANIPTFSTVPSAIMIMSWTNSTYATSYSVAVWDSTANLLKTTINSATSPTTFTDLINSHYYYFIVTASNSTVTTVTSTSSSAQYIAPIAPTIQSVNASASGNQISISWTNSGGTALNSVSWSISYFDQEGYGRGESNTISTTNTAIGDTYIYTANDFTFSYTITSTNASGSTSVSG